MVIYIPAIRLINGYLYYSDQQELSVNYHLYVICFFPTEILDQSFTVYSLIEKILFSFA